MTESWNISAARLEYRVLLSSEPSWRSPPISDFSNAQHCLQEDDCVWRYSSIGEGAGSVNDVGLPSLQDLEHTVERAFGFWLFPLEAFGSCEIDDFEHVITDLSEYCP